MLGTVRRHYEISMTREEVLERIAGSLDLEVPDWSASGVRGSRKFVGNIKRDGFQIRVRKTYRNGLEPVLKGKVSSTGATSEIDVRLGPALPARAFACAYFTCVALVGLAMLMWGRADVSRLTVALVILGLLSGGLFIVGFGIFLGRRDVRDLQALADDLFRAQTSDGGVNA